MLPTEKCQGKRGRWDFLSTTAEAKTVCLQKTDQISTCLDCRWSQRGTADRDHPKTPQNTDKAVPVWSWKENLSQGLWGTEQVVLSCKGCDSDSVTRHGRGGGRQSMTSARMEITSAAAWGHSLSCHLIALPGRAQGHSSFPLQFHLASFFLLLSLSPSFLLSFVFSVSLPLAISHDILCLFFLLLMHFYGSPPFKFIAFLPFLPWISAFFPSVKSDSI